MPLFFFTIDWIALWISLFAMGIAYLLTIFFPSGTPFLSFSFLKGLDLEQQDRSTWAFLPQRLHQLAFVCFLLAFIDPHLMIAKSLSSSNAKKSTQLNKELPPPTEGIAIYFILDQSGSMAQEVSAKGTRRKSQLISKMDLLKQVTEQFIKDQSSNLIGLVAFARIPHVLVPLTVDQETLLNQLAQLQVVKNQDDDGTALGYAIFKTANLIAATRHFAEELRGKGKPAYEIKGAAIIAVTDGLQDPNPLDQGNRLRTIELDDVADYVKSQGVRLYLINVDPKISLPEFAPHRRLMQKITELTGGKFYLLSDGQDLKQIYSEIDQLEKGLIQTEEAAKSQPSSSNKKDLGSHYTRFSFYPFLLGLGILFLLASIILETTLFRKAP
jgi:Ca-activated chloride channel family protein